MTEPVVERPEMADYGVPDDLDGTLPWSWARERLERCRNFWVVTASAAGRPHAMPVWGVWLDGPGEFWFSCSPNARKARNIVANAAVTIATSDTAEVVSLEGTAHRAIDDPRCSGAAAAWVRKYWDHAEGSVEFDEAVAFFTSHAAFVFTPQRGFGIVETEDLFAKAATRWRWSTDPLL